MSEWQTPDGQKACKRKGPVEWEERGDRYRLRWEPASKWWCLDVQWCHATNWGLYHRLTDHEAACLHRDHARHWLNTRDCAAIPVAALGLGATDKDYIGAILAVGKKD